MGPDSTWPQPHAGSGSPTPPCARGTAATASAPPATPGRHRRYSPDDLARLDLMHRALILGATPADAAAHALTALPPHSDTAQPPPATTERHPDTGTRTADLPTGAGPGQRQPAGSVGNDRLRARTGGTALRLPGARWRARGLGRAALALDADTARGLLADSIAATGVQATWDDVARPVLAAVGQRWADTGAGIEIEHLLSDCVTAVFSAVAPPPYPRVPRGRYCSPGWRAISTDYPSSYSPRHSRSGACPAGRWRRPAFDGTGDGDPAHRTGGGAAVVPAEIHRRPAGPAIATAHATPNIADSSQAPAGRRGGSTAGRTARVAREATDALGAAATV